MDTRLTPFFTSIAPWSERTRNTIAALSLAMERPEPLMVIKLSDALVVDGIVIGRNRHTLN